MSLHASAGKFRRVLRYALPEWRALIAIFILTIAYSSLAALQPWPLKILVDYALGSGEPTWLDKLLLHAGLGERALALIAVAAVASILIAVLNAGFDAALLLVWSHAGQRMVYALATDLFFKLQRLSLLFHARRSIGDALARLTGDTWTVYTITESLLIAPAKHCFVAVTVGIVAWQLSKELTVLILLCVPALVVSMLYFGRKLRGAERIKREAQARLTTFVHQVLGAVPLVQAFGAGRRNLALFRGIGDGVISAGGRSALLTQAYSAVNAVAMTIGVAVVVYVGGGKVLTHTISLGTLLVFIAYVRSLEGACRGLLQAYGSLRGAEASADRVLEILDSDAYVSESPGARPLPAGTDAANGRIVFENVTFGYDPGRPVLRGFSLEVEAAETLALVGSSGAGKTTIAALVPRLFDPWEGRVLLDGVDLRDIELVSLRSELAMVLQDACLLPISVLENIAYGRPDASRDDVIAAAVAANAHEFIRELPDGYDTILGEQGATLSGGQQQRIAIARAILKNPRVLILDEPTSALDMVTERLVMAALERLMMGRTTLIIAHRLTTVRAAKRIAVIDDGRIIEIGSHIELLARGGRYAQLYALSALGGTTEQAL